MADLVVVTKADGDNVSKSTAAKMDIQRALAPVSATDSAGFPSPALFIH